MLINNVQMLIVSDQANIVNLCTLSTQNLSWIVVKFLACNRQQFNKLNK